MLRFLHAKSHNVTARFSYLSWEELIDKIAKPPTYIGITPEQAKKKSEVIAATDASNKQKSTIIAHNNFTLLRLDLDETILEMETIHDVLQGMEIMSYVIHTTASHQYNNNGNRYRIYIQLANSICFTDWSLLETYLAYKFMADDCGSRPQQIMYLPCRLEGDNYMYKKSYGEPFNAENSKLLAQAIEFNTNQLKKLAQVKKDVTPNKSVNYHESIMGTQISIIDTVNKAYQWESLLLEYGYKKQGKAWLPPESASKQAGAYILVHKGKERYYSHHQNDPCASNHCLDIFDFICIRNYNGDYSRAIKDIAQTHFKQIDNHNKKEYAIHMENKRIRQDKVEVIK